MMDGTRAHFVTRDDVRVERFPWGPHAWLARPDVVDSEQLLVVRIELRRGRGCPFHRHPGMEEVVYVLQGVAEQWVGEQVRLLRAGEIAHVPTDTVHATFHAGRGVLRVLSILGAANSAGVPLVDVSDEEPWRSIRALQGGDVAGLRRALRTAKKSVAATAARLHPALRAQRTAAKKAPKKRRAALPAPRAQSRASAVRAAKNPAAKTRAAKGRVAKKHARTRRPRES